MTRKTPPTLSRRALRAAVLCLPLLWMPLGCTRRTFRAQGTIASEGGTLGTWQSTPIGCSRDPIDGPPADPSHPAATFLWDDILARDHFGQTHYPHMPNSPGRLEIWHTPTGFAATLETQKPVALTALDPIVDPTVCTTLDLNATEGPKLIPEGRPTLRGTLRLDCRVAGSHLTGQLHFSGCEF